MISEVRVCRLSCALANASSGVSQWNFGIRLRLRGPEKLEFAFSLQQLKLKLKLKLEAPEK